MSDDDDDQGFGPTSEPEEKEDRSTLRGVSDAVRKAFGAGVRSVVSSEEWVRGVVRDTLPRELVQYMKRQADAARDEVVRIIGNQTKRFLEGLDVGHEVQKILTALSFEIKTEIRFIPNDEKVKPDVKVGVRAKRANAKKERGREKRSSEPEADTSEE
ncbi:MAG: hypothetical protein H6745_14935 [Deltaproteobacteria bacterium]|nr:hypothetical protein [Deltaproteobacteria bacterium]